MRSPLVWLSAYLASVLIVFVVFYSVVGRVEPEKGPDWDAVADCVWEQWNTGANMTPVVRYCYEANGAGQ